MPNLFASEVLKHNFKDESLLIEALTHPSLSSSSEKITNYERLEFLGDAVLDLVISEFLYAEFPDEREGALAKRRAALVCGATLTKVARLVNLGKYLILSPGEENTGGRDNDTNLEDAFEAVLGALYLDGGLAPAEAFIFEHFREIARSTPIPPKDPKTKLQEWSQAKGNKVPLYEVTSQDGPSHAPEFTIRATVEGLAPAEAKGSSKRVAEREAAKILLEMITDDLD